MTDQIQKIVEQHATKKSELLERQEEQLAVLKEFENFELEDREDYQLAADYLIEVKKFMKAMEAGRKSFLAPFNELLEEFRGWYRPYWQALTDTEKLLKDKISKFNIAEEAKLLAAMKQASQAAQAGDFMGAHEATKKMLPAPVAQGITVTKKVVWKLEDLTKVPPEWTLKILNEEMVKEYCQKAGKRLPEPVPGLKFTLESPVIARTKRGR